MLVNNMRKSMTAKQGTTHIIQFFNALHELYLMFKKNTILYFSNFQYATCTNNYPTSYLKHTTQLEPHMVYNSSYTLDILYLI